MGYLLLLTDAYPYTGPLRGDAPRASEQPPAPAAPDDALPEAPDALPAAPDDALPAASLGNGPPGDTAPAPSGG